MIDGSISVVAALIYGFWTGIIDAGEPSRDELAIAIWRSFGVRR